MSTVEDRLADALAVRAQLETVGPEALAQHREEVRTAVQDDVVTLDRHGDPALSGAWVPPFEEVAARRRRRGLALAAAAVVLTAVALGVVRSPGGGLQPPASPTDSGFSVLDVPQTPADVPPSSVEVPDGVVATSVRALMRGGALSAWVAVDDRSRICLLLDLPDLAQSASSCGDREAARTTGVALGLADAGLTAVLVADGPADSTPADAGLLPVASQLWVDTATATRVADADIRALSADSFAVEPFVGTGSADLPVLSAPGTYAVLLRCLPVYAVDVEVSVRGAQEQQPGGCGSSNASDASVAALVDVGSAPQTVSVEASDGARWAVGVVRCTSVARQCPTAPDAVG